MWYINCCFYFLLMSISLEYVYPTDDYKDGSPDESFIIPLKRQKSPREQLLNTKKHGMSFEHVYNEYLKLKPVPRTNDSIALYRYLDNEFYGKIVIGHPGQELNVAFDTTWTYIWVLTANCSRMANVGCYFHNLYDHTKSSEYKPDGRPFLANEGKYNLTGYFSYENISFAHSNVTGQSFVEMEDVPWTFIFSKADGIMGLAQKASDYDPFFYTLRKQNKIKDPIFSIYLNRDRQSDHGGNVILGFVDKKHIHVTNKKYDPIKYLPVNPSYSYWEFQVDRIFVVGGHSFVLCSNGCSAAPDTSGNSIIGPVEDVKRIHNEMQASKFLHGLYTVNCGQINKLPKISFVLGGQNFTLKGENYIQTMSTSYVTVCVSAFREASTDFEQNIWFLGGAFLSEFYSIYNTDTKQIGFVRAA